MERDVTPVLSRGVCALRFDCSGNFVVWQLNLAFLLPGRASTHESLMIRRPRGCRRLVATNLLRIERKLKLMKWLNLIGALVLALGMNTTAQAGLFSGHHHGNDCCGAAKSCDCALACPRICCKPVICRPTCHKIYNYQRSCCKPCCCDTCAPTDCCAPKACCAPAGDACCAPKGGCAPAGDACCAPQACCAPAANACCAPAGNN